MNMGYLVTDLESPLLDNQARANNLPLDRFYDYFIKEMKGDPIPFGKIEAAQLATGVLGDPQAFTTGLLPMHSPKIKLPGLNILYLYVTPFQVVYF